MTMQCSDIKTHLLDIVYEELPKQTIEDAERHLSRCDACATLIDGYRLTRKLSAAAATPVIPSAMDAAILAAARARAAAARTDAPVTTGNTDALSWLSRIAENIRAVLLRPAFATAAAAGLVVVLSVFLVQRARDDGSLEGEVTALLQEAPLGPVMAPPPVAPKVLKPGPARGEAPAVAPGQTDRRTGQRSDTPPAEARGRRDAPPSPARIGDEESGAAIDPGISKKGRSTGVAPAPKASDSSGDRTATEAPSVPPTGARARGERLGASGPSPVASSKETPLRSGSALDAGMNAYARGECEQAIPQFEAVLANPAAYPGKRPLAIHHLAKCHNQAGRYSAALASYDMLIADHPAYGGMPKALSEAAGCAERLGRIDRARQLLDMLSTLPGWETKARRRLDELNKHR